MKSIVQIICQTTGIVAGVGIALALSATAASARPAYVASTVNLRAAPGTSSEIVGKIPGGSLVDAGDCSENWCAINWQGKSGFAIQTSIDMSGRVPAPASGRGPGPAAPRSARADGYVPVPEPGYVEDGPEYYEGPGPYYPGPYYGPGYGYYGGRYWGHRHRW
jgi:hypothetical protein